MLSSARIGKRMLLPNLFFCRKFFIFSGLSGVTRITEKPYCLLSESILGKACKQEMQPTDMKLISKELSLNFANCNDVAE